MFEEAALEPLQVARKELKRETSLELNAASCVNRGGYVGRLAQRTAVPR